MKCYCLFGKEVNMARDYSDFPKEEFLHVVKNMHNEYQDRFFHDIDLGWLVKALQNINVDQIADIEYNDETHMLVFYNEDGDVIAEVEFTATVGPAGPQGERGPTGSTPDIIMTATVGNTTGTPSVTVTKGGTTENPTFALAFENLKGEKGDTGARGETGASGADGQDGTDGITPVISAAATVTNTTGTPSVTVTKTGTTEAPTFTFDFENIKGEPGQAGQPGADGQDGTDGVDGVTPNISMTAQVSNTTGTPAVTVTKTGSNVAPNFDLAFTNIKGATGPAGPQGDPMRILAKYDTLAQLEAAHPTGQEGDMYQVGTSSGGGGTKNVWYATCDTTASTGTKVVTTSTGDFTLTAGNVINIYFTYGQTASSPKLNIDNTGAISIWKVGNSSARYIWDNKCMVSVVYNGTAFIMTNVGASAASATYFGMVKLNSTVTSTATTGEAAAPYAVKQAYDLANSKSSVTPNDPYSTSVGNLQNITIDGTNYTIPSGGGGGGSTPLSKEVAVANMTSGNIAALSNTQTGATLDIDCSNFYNSGECLPANIMFVKCIDNNTGGMVYNLPVLAYQVWYNNVGYGSFEDFFDSGSAIAMQDFTLHFWIQSSTQGIYHLTIGGTVQTVTDDGMGNTTGGTVLINNGQNTPAYNPANYIGQI